MAGKPGPLRFYIPGPPVGLEHEGARKGGGRRTEDKSRKYKKLAGFYALKAIAESAQNGKWPYEGDVHLDLEIYHVRKNPRPDPENVAAILQDGFTGVLWKNDRNVLPRINSHWWPDKTANGPPAVLFNGDKYIGGVLILVSKLK